MNDGEADCTSSTTFEVRLIYPYTIQGFTHCISGLSFQVRFAVNVTISYSPYFTVTASFSAYRKDALINLQQDICVTPGQREMGRETD